MNEYRMHTFLSMKVNLIGFVTVNNILIIYLLW